MMPPSPLRAAPDAEFGDDPLSMQDIVFKEQENATNESEGSPQSEPPQPEVPIMDKGTMKRYSVWVTLMVASSVSCASLAVGRTNMEAMGERRMCFAVLGITLVLSLGMNSCFLFPEFNPCTRVFISPFSSTGRLIELSLSVLMLILWCIGLPMIMNPANRIAVVFTEIVNANLYLGSWVCFGCVIYLVGDLMNVIYGGPGGFATGGMIDPDTGEYVTTSPFSQINAQRLWKTRRGKWFALATVTGIALSSSVRIFQALKCNLSVMKSNNMCIDTNVAISMTVLGGVFALVVLFVGHSTGSTGVTIDTTTGGGTSTIGQFVEWIGAVVTTIVWTIGLGFVTFGEGPGHSLGNLFFSMWAGFFISLLITTECYHDYIANRALAESTPEPSDPNIDQIELPAMNGSDDEDI